MLIDDDNTFLPETYLHYRATLHWRFCITGVFMVLASSGLELISKQSDA